MKLGKCKRAGERTCTWYILVLIDHTKHSSFDLHHLEMLGNTFMYFSVCVHFWLSPGKSQSYVKINIMIKLYNIYHSCLRRGYMCYATQLKHQIFLYKKRVPFFFRHSTTGPNLKSFCPSLQKCWVRSVYHQLKLNSFFFFLNFYGIVFFFWKFSFSMF